MPLDYCPARRSLVIFGYYLSIYLSHAEAQGRRSPIDATLVVNVMSIRISSITPPWLALFVINAVKYYRKVSEVARDWG